MIDKVVISSFPKGRLQHIILKLGHVFLYVIYSYVVSMYTFIIIYQLNPAVVASSLL